MDSAHSTMERKSRISMQGTGFIDSDMYAWTPSLPEARRLPSVRELSASGTDDAPEPDLTATTAPGESAAQAHGAAPSREPSPGLVTEFVRQSGYSDGTPATERREARRMLGVFWATFTALSAGALAVISALRHERKHR